VNLLYFGHLPMEGAGSAIIVLRHLRRLKAAGWIIQIVGDWGQNEAICQQEGWKVRYLPHRRAWWPPYRPPNDFSARLQHWLWAGEAKGLFEGPPPDAVMTYLSAFSDTLSQVAAAYCKRFNVPLTNLIHDDCRTFMTDPASSRWRRYRWVMAASSQNWFVSPELAEAYGFALDGRANVLWPLSEGGVKAPPAAPPAGPPLLVYAGNARDPQVPVLERMAGQLEGMGVRLMVLADKTPALAAALDRSPLEWRAPFPTNREALDWLQLHASALLVAYADRSEDQPWVKSSFPSKFVEFVHLGIPVLLAVPSDSAAAAWARNHGWDDLIRPEDEAGLLHFMRQLKDPKNWRLKGQSALRVAKAHFDPEHIQARLEARLSPNTLPEPLALPQRAQPISLS
jgi:glycosyltransferase involved in cell wall biosynthesis